MHKKNMFHVFNFLLPYTDISCGEKITSILCSHEMKYSNIDRLFDTMGSTATSTIQLLNCTILLKFSNNSRILNNTCGEYYFRSLNRNLKKYTINSNNEDTVLKIIHKYKNNICV